MTDTVRLDEFDKQEWREIVQACRPDVSDEEFERMWDEFQLLKRKKAVQ